MLHFSLLSCCFPLVLFFPTGFFPANIPACSYVLRIYTFQIVGDLETWSQLHLHHISLTRTPLFRSNIPLCLSGHLTAWPNSSPPQTLARAAASQQQQGSNYCSTVRQEQGIRALALLLRTSEVRSKTSRLCAAQYNPTRSSAPPRPGTVDKRTSTISLFWNGPHERA